MTHSMYQSLKSAGAIYFLDLPWELRDRIYEFILTSERQPPASPEQCGERWRDTDASAIRRNPSPYTTRFREVWYDVERMTFSCAAMLSCSRQTHREMTEVVQRWTARGNHGLLYKMDCMVRADLGEGRLRGIWPTWTALPAPPKHVKRLEFNFRDFSPLDVNGRGIKWRGNGGPGYIVSHLLRLLGQFVIRGPRLTCSLCNERQIAGESHILCNRCEKERIHLDTLVSGY